MVAYAKNSERGSMLVDSLLGLAVLTICSFILLPIYSGMQYFEDRQQAKLHAAQVLYSAVYFVKEQNVHAGEQQIEGRTYRWYFDNYSLCVQYELGRQEVEKCLSKTNQALH